MIVAVVDMVEFGEATAGELSVNNRSGKTKRMHGKRLSRRDPLQGELLDHFLSVRIGARAIPMDEKALAKMTSKVPLGRLGKPEEVSELIAFLASEKAGFITGQIIPVAGGWA